MSTQYQAYARLLTTYCLAVKPGEKVLIRSSYLAEPLVSQLYVALLDAGAHVDVDLSFLSQDRLYYDHASDDQLAKVSPLFEYVVDTFDCIVTIRAPFDRRSLQGVPQHKKLSHSRAMKPVKTRLMSRASTGDLRWVLCEFPTESAAQDCGMTVSEYETFIFEACFLHESDPESSWRQLSQQQADVVTLLNSCESFRFMGPNTDLVFSTAGRTWINSDGRRNMPSGEVFTSPVETSVHGTIFFDFPTLYEGDDVAGITLEIRDGDVVNWQADIGQSALDTAFAIDGSRRFGEVAIGMNSHITTPTKNILFDEKIGGTIHMAVGASYPETGGLNESALHWDMIKTMSEGQIYADDRLIYENGDFIDVVK